MSGRLNGKRIIITGAVDNIGKAAARSFVEEGARVVIGDIDQARGKSVAEEFRPAVRFLAVDVTDDAALKAFIDAGVRWLGGLDVLCQNVGLQLVGDIVDFSANDWDRLFAVNTRAQFLGAKFAVPHIRAVGKGSIINMASIAGVKGIPGATGYCASKGAVVLLTNALARELGKDNIRVNAICPGWVDTAFNEPYIAYMGGRAVQAEAVRRDVPLGRQCTPAEVAPLFVYLASDKSSFVSGQALLVDGGVHH